MLELLEIQIDLQNVILEPSTERELSAFIIRVVFPPP